MVVLAVIALVGFTGLNASAANCSGVPAFAICTAYANGAQVTFNNSLYHSIAPIPSNRDCPPNSPYNPGNDNWWVNDGACGSGTPTPTPTPTSTPNPSGTPTNTPTATPTGSGSGVGAIVSSLQFDQMLPSRVSFYSYNGFVSGGNAASGFCTTGDNPTRIRECAAFLANAAHETGGGVYITEIAQNQCPTYCDTSQPAVCDPWPGQAYYGRGWLQLSWNFNYCAASKYIYNDDGHTLIQNPNILQQDAAKTTQASLWYWMTQNGPGTMPAHSCITTGAGFGCTIRSINGALECNGGNPAQVQSRINNYVNFLAILGGTAVGPNGC